MARRQQSVSIGQNGAAGVQPDVDEDHLHQAARISSWSDETAIEGLQRLILLDFDSCSVEAKNAASTVIRWTLNRVLCAPSKQAFFAKDENGIPRVTKCCGFHPSVDRYFGWKTPTGEISRIPGILVVLVILLDAQPIWISLLEKAAKENRAVLLTEIEAADFPATDGARGPGVYCASLDDRFKIGFTARRNMHHRTATYVNNPVKGSTEWAIAYNQRQSGPRFWCVLSLASRRLGPLLGQVLGMAMETIIIAVTGSSEPRRGFNSHITDMTFFKGRSMIASSEEYLAAYRDFAARIQDSDARGKRIAFGIGWSPQRWSDEFAKHFRTPPAGPTLLVTLRLCAAVAHFEQIPGLPVVPSWAWARGQPLKTRRYIADSDTDEDCDADDSAGDI